MRQVLIFLLLFLGFISFSQTAPQKINYQGIVRSNNGNPITGKPIGINFQILQGSATGTSIYSEPVTVTSSGLGLINTQIGNGTGFSQINWANGPYFLKVSIDTTGGTTYVALPNPQQLTSVPYALYAESTNLNFDPTTNILTVGNKTALVIPVSNTIIATGAITSTIVGNTYTVNAPVVTVSDYMSPINPGQLGGLAQVLGTYPNYSIAVAPIIAFTPSVGVLSLASIPGNLPAYNYTYNVTPQLSINGNTIFVGPVTNSVDLSALVSAGSTTSLSIGAGGTGTISNPSTNNFSITIPPTNITGPQVLGAFPNYTITSTPQTVVTGSGTALPVVSVSGNTYNVSVPAPTITTTGGGITQSGAYPNITLNSPSVSVVHNPAVGLANVTGSYPNYTVTVAPAFNYNPSTGSLVVLNTFSPQLSYTFNVTPTLAYTNGTITSGPGTNSIAIPAPTITAAGGAVVTNAFPNYTVSAPQQINLTTTGATTMGGTYPNINIGSPPVTLTGGALIYPPGFLQIMGSYPNYSLLATPNINYSQTTGSLTLSNFPGTTPPYSYAYNTTPGLSVTNNVIQSGPPTNTIAFVSPPAQAITGISASGVTANSGGVLVVGSLAFTKLSATSQIEVYLHCLASSGSFSGASSITYELRVDNLASVVSSDHAIISQGITENITLRAFFSGLSAGSHTVSVWAKTNAGTSGSVALDPPGTGKIILKETY